MGAAPPPIFFHPLSLPYPYYTGEIWRKRPTLAQVIRPSARSNPTPLGISEAEPHEANFVRTGTEVFAFLKNEADRECRPCPVAQTADAQVDMALILLQTSRTVSAEGTALAYASHRVP